jgi:branched-chain amino acid transport system permease protein
MQLLQILTVQVVTGLTNAMFLFLIASGLTLIFGVTRIVNFAHGSFYMLSSYITYSLMAALGPWEARFWVSLILAPAAVAMVGYIIERLLLRRIYGSPELFQLLLTFGLVLIFGDLVKAVWGTDNKSVPVPEQVSGSFTLLGQQFPHYYLLVLALGPVVTLGLWWVFYRTRWGMLIRAATEDREMVAALGVDQGRLFTGVFVFGSWLAGLGGALAAPVMAISPGMDTAVIVEAFVVVVVGGMGSFSGALLAAILIGILKAVGIMIVPGISIVLIFAFMAVVLILKPWGLAGRPMAEIRGAPPPRGAALGPSRGLYAAALLGGALLLSLPLWAGRFWLVVAGEVFAFALFATSLNLLWGYGGMVSFGHAAYFGLGAYTSALLLQKAQISMSLCFLISPCVAGAAGLIFGFFCVRLSHIYLAMLTLAFAQILYTIALQWYDFTGGDNGLLGIWPTGPLGTPLGYYYLSLGLAALGICAVWMVVRSPFGAALRALRDNPARAESIGIPVRLYQLVAFVISGFFSGLAGVIFVFQKGSVFPDYLFVVKSIEPLIMILLGGMHSFAGPLIGSGVFKLLDTVITSGTEYWQAVLGGILAGLVLMFPQGITGYTGRHREGGRA